MFQVVYYHPDHPVGHLNAETFKDALRLAGIVARHTDPVYQTIEIEEEGVVIKRIR